MSNLANNTVTMNEILALIDSLPEGGAELADYTNNYITEIGDYAYYFLPDILKSATFGKVQTVGNRAFMRSQVPSVSLPVATTLRAYAFSGDIKLTDLNIPAVTTIEERAFMQCSALSVIDLPSATSVGSRAFAFCNALTALILRSGTMCIAAANEVLQTSGVESGIGYIYVPAALVDTYKADANWSKYAARFRALENYTVDGTTTGALDETKI